MVKNIISACLPAYKNRIQIFHKHIVFTLLLFILFTDGYCQDKKQLIRQNLDILKKYDAQGSYMVRYIQKLPTNYNLCGTKITFSSSEKVENYLNKSTFEEMFWQLPTLVHEFNHEYTSHPYLYMQKNNICDMENKYYVYFLDTGNTHLVKLSKVFPSKKIYGYIQKNNLITFRVDTYINGNTSTQTSGVFGLLDEMNAYRMGAATMVNLIRYYVENEGSYDKWIIEYLENTQSVMMAYFEFKFFILRYLMYAQENEKEVYKNIMSNIPFLKTFVAVEQSFQKTVNEYIAFYSKAFSEIQKKGIAVSNEVDSEYIFINGEGTVLLEKNKEYKKLTEELNKPEYEKMMDLLLSKTK